MLKLRLCAPIRLDMNIAMYTDWERSETGWLLADLDRYLDTMEAALEDTRALHRSTLHLSEHEYEEEAEWDEAWRDYYTRFEEEFPTKLRYSFLILLHSYLEARTKSFCNALLSRRIVAGAAFKKRPQKTHLESVQEFFSRYAPLADAADPHWAPLLAHEQLRNCIVHHNGVIKEYRDPERLYGIIDSNEGLSRGFGGEIGVALPYCKRAIAASKLFFNTCFDAAGFCPRKTVVLETT